MKRVILITIFSVFTVAMIYWTLSAMRPTHDIGNVEVKGFSTVYFKLEQENDFDMATAISYGIFNKHGNTIAPMRFLVGTHDFINSPENFEANSVDSIIYLTWGDTTAVYAVYDLSSQKGYPSREESWKESFFVADTLLKRIQSKKPYLRGK